LNQSSDTDAAIQAIQNKQFEMEFKADYDAYRKRVLTLENNKTARMHCSVLGTMQE
jgi:hypothetical protein